MAEVDPYRYPDQPHQRKHGPAGYRDYRGYRPWLQDDFAFRCIYCLKRMAWAPTDIWVVDHLVSRSEAPELACEYDNLVFACQFCNEQKGSHRVPDPCLVAYGNCLRANQDGSVTPQNRDGRRLETALCLNHPRFREERAKMIEIIAVLREAKHEAFERLMGFPRDLPDLEKLRAPQNRRPEGTSQSHFARRQRGELPAVY